MPLTEKHPAGLTIAVQEHEHTILNADNTISRFDPRGTVTINNASRVHAIWDAELEVNRPNRTTLGSNALDVGRLEPMGEWKKEFIVKDIEGPMLLLTEVVDTYHERVGIGNALVFDYSMPVEFSIDLRNHSGTKITDIVVTKTLPPFFQKLEIQKTQIGKVRHDSTTGQVVWTIPELPPERLATQRFRAIVKAEDTQPKGGGPVQVAYRVPDVVRGGLAPVLHGASELQVDVEKEEHPMRHGTWRCKATLLNTSQFPIRLERVQVVLTAPTSDLLYEATPNLRLEPDEVWGHEFEVTAEQPEFDVITLTTVEAPITKEIVGTIEKAENTFPILRVECFKTVEPLTLLAWEPAPVAVTLRARNAGTAECDDLAFIDTIPAGFEPPENTQVRVRLGNRPMTKSVDVSLNPAKQDLNTPYSITIRLRDLTEIHSAIKPGEEVTANYIMIARAPKPQQDHRLPLRVEAKAFPPGPAAVATIDQSIAPTIQVRAVARKLRKTRTVAPGEKKGDLVVTVTFVNESESSLHDPELQDLIPPDFEYVGTPQGSKEPTVRDTMNGTLVSWSLPTMMRGEKIVAKYIYRSKA